MVVVVSGWMDEWVRKRVGTCMVWCSRQRVVAEVVVGGWVVGVGWR
jgi:hypothetical protein